MSRKRGDGDWDGHSVVCGSDGRYRYYAQQSSL